MTWKSCQEVLSKLRIDLPRKVELLLEDWFGHIAFFNFKTVIVLANHFFQAMRM